MYGFGQYVIDVQGSADLTFYLEHVWRAYRKLPDMPLAAVTLQVERSETLCGAAGGEGWNFCWQDNRRLAVYVLNRQAVFGLRYVPGSRHVTVLVDKAGEAPALLGLQFGLMLALSDRCIGLHGVTLLCGNEILILSAPSGTGKTTLSQLLEKYCDAVVINGDFALLTLTEEGLVFVPTPFCGSSGRCLNHMVRVSRIVFLEQAKENRWQTLAGRQAMIRCLSNTFIPEGEDCLQRSVEENILRAVSLAAIDSYAFSPTREAAEEFFKHVSTGNHVFPE